MTEAVITRRRFSNSTLGVWAAIFSSVWLLVALLVAFVNNQTSAIEDTGANDAQSDLAHAVGVPFGWVISFAMLGGMLAVFLSWRFISKGDPRRSKVWLFSAIMFGIVFLGGQVFAVGEMASDDFGLSTSLDSAGFYGLVGLHFTEVAVTVIWLCIVFAAGLQTRAAGSNAGPNADLNLGGTAGMVLERSEVWLRVASWYWGFLAVAWLIIFSVGYLFVT